MDPLLLAGLCVVGGWLLARLGVGEHLNLPFLPTKEKKDAEPQASKPTVVYVPQPAVPVVDHKQVLAQAMKTVKDSLDAKASAEFEALLAQAKPQ